MVVHSVQSMSLTGHLKNPSSQVRKFFDENLPHTNVQPLRRLILEGLKSGSHSHDSTSLADIDLTAPWDAGLLSVLPENSDNYPWM